MAATATADEDYQIVSTAVDQAFYRTVYPDLDQPGLDVARHYLEEGWREGRDPAPWFSVRRYLERHSDVAAGGLEPLLHFLRHGGPESREIFPSDHVGVFRSRVGETAWSYAPPLPSLGRAPEAERETPEIPRAAPYAEADRLLVEAEFDEKFYGETNPDVLRTGASLVEHYLVHGWREGRDPTPWFSVREYLQDNTDVVRAGVDPFVHYLAAGRAEGRAAKSALGFRYKVIAAQAPLETRLAEAATQSRKIEPSPAGALAAAAGRSRTGLRDLHLTFSHDDFNANVGGVQLCLQYEAARIAALGRDHLHLFPAYPWPVLRVGESALLGASLNGELLGAFPAGEIAHALQAAQAGRTQGSFAIHNLLGHSVDEVVAIVAACGVTAGFFWLHDFTSLCAGYQLLRNDVADCAAPPPDSPACNVCLYSPARAAQTAEHERLFRRLRLTVVSPSQVTLDFWRSRARYPTAGEIVHPHVRFVRRERAAAPAPGPLRIAFLGMPATHKGWPIFAELAARYAGDGRYRFFHLGARRDPRADIEFHPVRVSLDDPAAMQTALERLEIDVALIWSIFRETFCLAAYEALAGGAAVVTGPDSANVAALVESSGAGLVLPDEAALAQALADGALLPLARAARRPWLSDLEFSGLTADLITTSVAA